MDLKELTDPLPKPWLNINANNMTAVIVTAEDVNATIADVGTLLASTDLNIGNNYGKYLGTTVGLSPSNVVNGTGGFLAAQTSPPIVVNFPTGASLLSYINQPGLASFSFKFDASVSSGTIADFRCNGPSMTLYNGNTDVVLFQGSHTTFTFTYTSGTWEIYF